MSTDLNNNLFKDTNKGADIIELKRYIVQLKEEVPLDFIKNYEILEDKGNDIYIVREKGNE